MLTPRFSAEQSSPGHYILHPIYPVTAVEILPVSIEKDNLYLSEIVLPLVSAMAGNLYRSMEETPLPFSFNKSGLCVLATSGLYTITLAVEELAKKKIPSRKDTISLARTAITGVLTPVMWGATMGIPSSKGELIALSVLCGVTAAGIDYLAKNSKRRTQDFPLEINNV